MHNKKLIKAMYKSLMTLSISENNGLLKLEVKGNYFSNIPPISNRMVR